MSKLNITDFFFVHFMDFRLPHGYFCSFHVKLVSRQTERTRRAQGGKKKSKMVKIIKKVSWEKKKKENKAKKKIKETERHLRRQSTGWAFDWIHLRVIWIYGIDFCFEIYIHVHPYFDLKICITKCT